MIACKREVSANAEEFTATVVQIDASVLRRRQKYDCVKRR
jgi:hypothetical protein